MFKTRKKIISVYELTSSIKNLLEGHFRFISVKGEISNLKTPYSGHSYFTLKDNDAQIRGVLFKNQKRFLLTPLQEGKEVVCHGRITVYEPRGDYQILVDSVEELGHGELRVKFDQLKKDLEERGLFNQDRKKTIPYFPGSICLITSATGAALQDFLKIYRERSGNNHIQILPTAVQGERAAGEIVKAIGTANSKLKPDVIVLCRGGGSIEDLWPYNEEIVAEAIYNSAIPIVTGIGHETDFTIADFCADYRVATPTGAAELLITNRNELKTEINNQLKNLIRIIENKLVSNQARLHGYKKSLTRIVHLLDKNSFRLQLSESYLVASINNYLVNKVQHTNQIAARLKEQAPLHRIEMQKQKLDYLHEKLINRLEYIVESKTKSLARQASLLNSVSPLATLSRGYAVAYKKTGKKRTVITSPQQVQIKDTLHILVKEGELGCQVISKEN